jgi:hypothetical protein
VESGHRGMEYVVYRDGGTRRKRIFEKKKKTNSNSPTQFYTSYSEGEPAIRSVF